MNCKWSTFHFLVFYIICIQLLACRPNKEKLEFTLSIDGYKANKVGQAIHDGNLEELIRFKGLGLGFDSTLTDETYVFDALYAAIAFGKIPIVKWLLDQSNHPDVNKAYTEESETPLTMACALEDTVAAFELAQMLIAAGAKVDGIGSSGGEETKYPLFCAIQKNHLNLVRLLLEKGASLDITNSQGETPKAFAEANGYTEIQSLLNEQ